MRVSRFLSRLLALSSSSSHLPAPDLSGHCRTSTPNSGDQWSAGPQLRVPGLRGQCKPSTASGHCRPQHELRITVGTAGPQPRPPELSGHSGPLQAPDLSGHCRTSTAGSRLQWTLPDINRKLQSQPELNCERPLRSGARG